MTETTPPPPYEEIEAPTHVQLTPGGPLMPLDFNVYSESATSGFVYFIGPHQNERQFALTLHRNSLEQAPGPVIILHDGLTRQDPAIGTASNTWTAGRHNKHDEFIISIPYLAASHGLPSIQEKLVAVDEGTYWRPVIRMRYSLQVTQADEASGGIRVERKEFEWQESCSHEILRLRGKQNGWRLVATENASETLALCAPNGGSLTKFLRFSFRGNGRKSGYYGPSWEIMAVLTGLTTWRRRIEILDRMG